MKPMFTFAVVALLTASVPQPSQSQTAGSETQTSLARPFVIKGHTLGESIEQFTQLETDGSLRRRVDECEQKLAKHPKDRDCRNFLESERSNGEFTWTEYQWNSLKLRQT